MTLNQGFKVTVYLQVEYLKNSVLSGGYPVPGYIVNHRSLALIRRSCCSNF